MAARGSFGQWTTVYGPRVDPLSMTGAQAHRWALTRGDGCTRDGCDPQSHRHHDKRTTSTSKSKAEDASRRRGGRDTARRGGRRAR